MPKFFYKNEFETDKPVEFTDSDAAHMISALRCKPGDSIIVCDKNGCDRRCVIESIKDGTVRAVLDGSTESIRGNSEPKTRIHLFQSIIKGSGMETAIQKSVEAGVYSIIPVITERTIAIPSDPAKKTLRYQAVAEAAAKQSMRSYIPIVNETIRIKSKGDMINAVKGLDLLLVAYENADDTNIKRYFENIGGCEIGLFIGPEGGFGSNEIEMLRECGAREISLGKRVFKAETAGFAAVILILYESGEL